MALRCPCPLYRARRRAPRAWYVLAAGGDRDRRQRYNPHPHQAGRASGSGRHTGHGALARPYDRKLYLRGYPRPVSAVAVKTNGAAHRPRRPISHTLLLAGKYNHVVEIAFFGFEVLGNGKGLAVLRNRAFFGER